MAILRKKSEGLRDLDYRSLCTRLRDARVAHGAKETIVDRVMAWNVAADEASDRRIRKVAEQTAEGLAEAYQFGLRS